MYWVKKFIELEKFVGERKKFSTSWVDVDYVLKNITFIILK